MNTTTELIYQYDRTLDGMLTCVFDTYARRERPTQILANTDPLPLFTEHIHHVTTDTGKAGRVWRKLESQLTREALRAITISHLSEQPTLDLPLFRYLAKAVVASRGFEHNFSDEDVLCVTNMARRVSRECLHIMQFVRFQKAADGTFFALVEPDCNVLPLAINHFSDRFNDQPFLLFDKRRQYGYYHADGQTTHVTPDQQAPHFITGRLDDTLLAPDEKLYEQLWQTYFKAICIRERLNPRKQRQDMPVRYWKYLTEKHPTDNLTPHDE